jgi:hypothetical protein
MYIGGGRNVIAIVCVILPIGNSQEFLLVSTLFIFLWENGPAKSKKKIFFFYLIRFFVLRLFTGFVRIGPDVLSSPNLIRTFE